MNFDRIKNLFKSQEKPSAERVPEQSKEVKKTVPVVIRGINPYAFGSSGYVIEETAHGLWRELGKRYMQNGVTPLSPESILGPNNGRDYSDRKIALDNLATSTRDQRQLLIIDKDGNIIPSENFGILY